MKMPHELHGKNLLSLIILLLLVLSLPNVLSLNTVEASPGEYPSIYIEPAVTEKTLTPGESYNISVCTNYTGDDIWSWAFTLTYDPRVLHGGIKKTDTWIGGTNTTDTWIGNNVTKSFITTEKPVVPDSEKVYVDLTLMTKPENYTIKYSTGNITFTTAPGEGANVTAIYLPLTFSTTEKPVVEDSEEVYVDLTLMTRITERKDTWIGDGVTRTFYTAQPVFPGSETVFIDRTYRKFKYTHYIIDYSTGNITFKDAPEIDEVIDVTYDTYMDYAINYEKGKITFPLPTTDTWDGDGMTKTFSTTEKPVVSGSETVYENQIRIAKPAKYSIDYEKGEITFVTPPAAGAEIEATYTYLSTPAAGAEIEATYLYNGVNNGDLITKEKHSSAIFREGTFDNTIGKLSQTGAMFFVFQKPYPTTSGPGTLANITFTVVGFGATNITLGPETVLLDPEPGIITDHTQHGYLLNVQPIHDVAVFSLVAPDKAFLRELVPINVTVVNEGNHTEPVTVTVYNDTTEIGTESFTLARGLFKIVSFSWNTAGVGLGTYTINATATIAFDEDPSDNTDTEQIELKKTHDVAIVNILAPTTVAVGELVSVNVTIANQGHYKENVTLTVSYIQRQSLAGTDVDVVLDTATANFTLNEGSKTVSSKWNTTGLNTTGSYDGLTISYLINATVTVLKSIENPRGIDKAPGDNIGIKQIELKLSYDVEIDRISVDRYPVVVGDLIGITVVVKNVGVYSATDFSVEVTYDAGSIETQPVELLLPGNSTSLLFSWDTRDVDPASYTITAEAILDTDQDLTNNNATKSIFIKAPPIASFTFSPTEPIVGETVTFDASASDDLDGTIDSYFWDFGDGNTELYVRDVNLTATATHAYTAAGTYTVNLTVTDDDGLTDTATTDVTVLLHEIAITSVTASPNTVKIGEPVSINVTVVNQGTEKETFNVTVYYDDTIIGTQSITELGSGASQSLIFSWDTSDVSAGTYTIKASATTVTDETDTDDNTFTDGTVTVKEAPALGILPYAAAAGAAAIIIAAVAIYFLKIRKPKPT